MARTRNTAGPRPIQPELIDEGDIIEVQYPDDGGITMIKRGVVAHINSHAGMCHFLAQQGGVIGRYAPGAFKKPSEKFYLIARMPRSHEMLDMFAERLI